MGWSYYPRFPGDYKRDTAHLSMTEHGAYALLMDYYYSTGPIPINGGSAQSSLDVSHDTGLMRVCCALDDQERAAVASVITQFFYVKDGLYHQKKCDEVLKDRAEISEKRKKAVEAREKKKKNKRSRDTSHDTSSDHLTRTRTKDSISLPKGNSCSTCTDMKIQHNSGVLMNWSDLVDMLWKDYPRVGRAIRDKAKFNTELKKLLEKEGKNETDWQNIIRDIARGIRKYRKYCEATGEKQPDPHRWIARRGWEDDYSYSEPSDKRTGPSGSESPGTVDQIADAAEKAKEMLR